MPISNKKLLPSPLGIYHAATVTCPDAGAVGNFEFMAGKSIVWTMVSNVWLNEAREGKPADPGIWFPWAAVTELTYNTTNCLPFIRISPRSRREKWRKQAEPLYSVQAIADGKFDPELLQWGLAAKNFDKPLLVEFGAEMNGYWQPWNAKYNGAGQSAGEDAPDGKPRYKGQKAYRDAHCRIINLFDTIGVDNITWIFHVNYNNAPKDEWNRMAGYYPGDEYIDWIGVSCYAAHTLEPLTPLKDIIDPVIDEIRTFSPGVVAGTKPIAIAELGAIDYPDSSKPNWIRDAYDLLANQSGNHGPYRDQIKAVSWWDETWWQGEENGTPAFLANNSIASSPASVKAYREAVNHPRLLGSAW